MIMGYKLVCKGHFSGISLMAYVPDTLFYVSFDRSDVLLVNDIRTGEVYKTIDFGILFMNSGETDAH